MFPLTRAFARAVNALIFGRSGGAALRAAFSGGSAKGRLWHPRGAAPQVRSPVPEVWSPVSQVPGGSSKTSNPNTKNLKGSQSDPLKDPPLGCVVFAGLGRPGG